ncbi:MAG: CRISPR-associated helicase Cas3' [Methanophagales archaeon]|nr:CRISPR-associated helicase Cas3' [Methanophagales archaeon]
MIEEFYRGYLGISDPYSHQKEMWNKIIERNFPLIVKAPTGSGKTEGVIAPFLYQFVENKFSIAPRLIYVLPMRVLVNSIAKRIGEYAQKVSNEISVEIQHGELPNDPFFIDDIVVTTLDQFIYAYARTSKQVGRHLDIPVGAIASSIVVFDEAHMYRDEFTFSMMRALVEILYNAKIPFIMMTATMPETLEESLFENIDFDKKNKIIPKEFNLANKINISFEKGALYKNDEVSISEEILDKIRERKTLIVVNQVKRAQKIYDEIKNRLGLKERAEIVLLHSQFTRKDRKEHEDEAMRILPHKEKGKIMSSEGIGVVVSTQVLEAGMDVSAELLLTEISPADSLVQRAGRCARYENQTGEMIIFPLEGERAEKPYFKDHLDTTSKWLDNHLESNLRNFSEVLEFINVLDYRADDYAAKDSLVDLYECILYADTTPRNIQVRESKPATLLVMDRLLGITDWKSNPINVDVRVVWRLFKEGKIRREIRWNITASKEKKLEIRDLGKPTEDEEDPRIGPFRTYILDKNYYDSLKGVVGEINDVVI